MLPSGLPRLSSMCRHASEVIRYGHPCLVLPVERAAERVKGQVAVGVVREGLRIDPIPLELVCLDPNGEWAGSSRGIHADGSIATDRVHQESCGHSTLGGQIDGLCNTEKEKSE